MKAEPYQVRWTNRLARSILRPTFRAIFYSLANVQISGKENIPQQGSYLIAMNHVSIVDPPFIIAFWPICPEAIGAVEVWSRPGQAILVRLYGGIPVHRGQVDRKVIEKMLSVLQSGRPLVIAPEGERSHKPGMQRGLPGIAYATSQAQVPVVPVGISGTTDDFFQRVRHGERPQLEMNIGAPLILPPITGSGEERRIARQHYVDLIMYQIASLLPDEYRGVYDEPINEAG